MTTRIEIQEQPERQRWWAEVEIGGMVARRKVLDSPKADGLAGIIALVMETHAAMLPKPVPKPPEPVEEPPPGPRNVDERRWVVPTAVTREMLGRGEDERPVETADDHDPPSSDIDALRAAAEAAGVRVDKRWGSDRLRQEIAAVGHERASTGD